ncbi:MAG TPA: hypothetical protein VGD74_09555 [Vulgatibacter sp.]
MSGPGTRQPFGDGIEDDSEARQRVQQFAREASAQVEQARMFLEDINERVTAFVREKPGTALIGAVALGWVLGKIASKASR